MRKFIEIMESIRDESLVARVADLVRSGEHEGFSPYWKLTADQRILEDEAAMAHISDLISAGFTSGHHPTWDLKVIEGDGDAPVSDNAPVAVDHGIVDEDAAPKHRVVAVHQREGAGNGWYECMDEEAEVYVVEDDAGEPVESYHDRNSAEAHAHHLNSGEELLLDGDIDPTDNAEIDAHDVPAEIDSPSIFADAPDHEVEIAAMHDRGHIQDEAFRELAARGIELNEIQVAQAGRAA